MASCIAQLPMITFHLHDNGRSIELKRSGWSIPVNSWLTLVFLGLVCFVVAAMIVGDLAGKVSDDWYLRFDWWWRILVYLGLFLGALFLVAGLPLIGVLQQLGFIKSVRWNQAGQQLEVTRCGLLGLRRRQYVPFDQISRMNLIVGEEDGSNLALQLQVITESSRDIVFGMRIREIDQRAEAIDLLLKLASTCGLAYYRIEVPETTSMRAFASREESTGSRPIPQAQTWARYDLNLTATPVHIPPPLVGDFLPSDYAKWDIRLEQWEPGSRIQFLRPEPTWRETILVGAVFSLLVGILFGVSLSNQSGLNRLWAAGMAAVLVAPLAGLVYRVRYPKLEAIIDSSLQQFRWSRGMRTFAFNLREVHRIVLREKKCVRTPRRRRGPAYPIYQCQLFLKTSDGREWLLTKNDAFSPDRDAQRRALEPLAATLGQSLNVEWQWIGHRDTAVKKLASSASLSLVLLALIGVIGFFGWAYWQQKKTDAHWDEIAGRMELIGTRVTRAGVNIGNEQMFGNGMFVEVLKPEFNDQDLAQVLKLLEPIHLYGLDLSHSAVTDAGVDLFCNRPALRYLNLRGTNVTSEVATILAKTQLSGLDVRDTALRLEHLAALEKLYSLNVLLFSDDVVSIRQLSVLGQIGRLRAVMINDRPTTERWLFRGGSLGSDTESRVEEEGPTPPGLSRLTVAGEIIFLGR